MKESFGFIERADVVKEIFFHFSEAENGAGSGSSIFGSQSSNSSAAAADPSQTTRETGIIEKLLVSRRETLSRDHNI